MAWRTICAYVRVSGPLVCIVQEAFHFMGVDRYLRLGCDYF